MEAKYFLLPCPARKSSGVICNGFTHNNAIWHPAFSTSLQNQRGSLTSTCLPIMPLCLYPHFIPMTVNADILFYVSIMHIIILLLRNTLQFFSIVQKEIQIKLFRRPLILGCHMYSVKNSDFFCHWIQRKNKNLQHHRRLQHIV